MSEMYGMQEKLREEREVSYQNRPKTYTGMWAVITQALYCEQCQPSELEKRTTNPFLCDITLFSTLNYGNSIQINR